MRQLVLDDIIQRIFSTVGFSRGSDEQWQSAPKQCRQWQEVYDLLHGLPPETRAAKASSLYWPHIWLSVQRESWEEIKTLHTDGNEADIVDIKEELEGDWQLEYPYEIDWFRAAFELVGGTLYFSLLPKESCLLLKLDQYLVSGPLDLDDEEVRQGFEDYTDWATTALRQELERLLDGSDAYRDALEQRLPKRERYGKLRRQDFWEVASDTEHFLRDELTQEDVARFIAISDGLTGDIALRDLTLNDFLRFCAICYEGAGYDFIGLTPRDQYLAKADGRHDGLLDITPTSSQALRDWFSVGQRGGHPWEIVRGGNTTHISLFLSQYDEGYKLLLEGSAQSRGAETIRIALALWRHNIPFELFQADHLKRMADGEDWIGVVPHYFGLAPRYCEEFFPKEDRIHEFMSVLSLEEYPGLEQLVEWYPLERINLLAPSDLNSARNFNKTNKSD